VSTNKTDTGAEVLTFPKAHLNALYEARTTGVLLERHEVTLALVESFMVAMSVEC
jgi:hypothetical protein